MIGEGPGSLDRVALLRRVRGLLLGAAVGEAVALERAGAPAGQTGLVTQLLCVGTEGIIRAGVRGDHKGITTVAGCVQHATARWAARRGWHAQVQRERWAHGEHWPDGWLAEIPVLAADRGHSPAIETAAAGAFEQPTVSKGAHALSRVLPLALLGAVGPGPVEEATAVCRQTHGHPEAVLAVRYLVNAAGWCVTARSATLAGSLSTSATHEPDDLQMAQHVIELTLTSRSAEIGRVGADRTATSTLTAAVMAARRHRDDPVGAAREACAAAEAPVAAAVACALVSATEGVDALPLPLLLRLDLLWPVDTLARDFV